MYEDTDYDALEGNVKYIPWKGKKEEWYTGTRLFWFVQLSWNSSRARVGTK